MKKWFLNWKSLPSFAASFCSFCIGSPVSLAGPSTIFIEPTNLCNLNCPLCATGSGLLKRRTGFMSTEKFKKAIDSLSPGVRELYLWGQGEPFMAPGFLDMVNYASSKGYMTRTSSNGHFSDSPETICKSGLDVLIISLDGIDSESYQSYRKGGDFDKVINNIAEIAFYKKNHGTGPVIEVQHLVTKKNQSGLRNFRSFARSIGADRVVFKTLQGISFSSAEEYLPDESSYSRYKRKDRGLEPDLLPFLGRKCLRIYHSAQIDWQGNVLPCCFDKDSQYVMGNIFEDNLKNIWNSGKFRGFRYSLNKNGRTLPMCRDCTEGLRRRTVHV